MKKKSKLSLQILFSHIIYFTLIANTLSQNTLSDWYINKSNINPAYNDFNQKISVFGQLDYLPTSPFPHRTNYYKVGISSDILNMAGINLNYIHDVSGVNISNHFQTNFSFKIPIQKYYLQLGLGLKYSNLFYNYSKFDSDDDGIILNNEIEAIHALYNQIGILFKSKHICTGFSFIDLNTYSNNSFSYPIPPHINYTFEATINIKDNQSILFDNWLFLSTKGQILAKNIAIYYRHKYLKPGIASTLGYNIQFPLFFEHDLISFGIVPVTNIRKGLGDRHLYITLHLKTSFKYSKE